MSVWLEKGGALFNGQGGTLEGTIVQGVIAERVRTPGQVRVAWDKAIYKPAVALVAESRGEACYQSLLRC